MNSEELEQSLRSEFENYLKDLVAGMKSDVDEFQKKIEADFDAHKARTDEAFQAFSEHFSSEHQFDAAFGESVVEHLRLARDEGAKIAATAFAEAEDLDRSTRVEVNYGDIKDAINDISSQTSQLTILKSLITHAANFTQRGAFFIVKSDNFAGWKVFGKEGDGDETAIRNILFPTSADSILGKAVANLSTVEAAFGAYSDDEQFLEPLQFGRPDRMYAIPLVARGRGVAVLYADYGNEGVNLNTDILETLVKVAGLTVELNASAKAQPVAAEEPATNGYQDDSPAEPETAPAYESVGGYEPAAPESDTAYPAVSSFDTPTTGPEPDVSFGSAYNFEPPVVESETTADHIGTFEPATDEVESTYEHTSSFEPAEPQVESTFEQASTFEPATSFEPVSESHAGDFEFSESSTASENRAEQFDAPSFSESSTESFETTTPLAAYEAEPVPVTDYSSFDPQTIPEVHAVETEEPTTSEYTFGNETAPEPEAVAEAPIAPETPVVDNSYTYEAAPFDRPTEPTPEPEVITAPAPAMETVEVVTPAPPRSRLSDRQIDLPVEVAEDERRLHNDARRFARLLVSEIKLYNEQKVKEGREASDLYPRLKDAIDRSREMYDKRVQPPVAAKFDYFNYELVNSLAEGDETRLGSGYSGATV